MKSKIAITSDSHGSLDRLSALLSSLSQDKISTLIHAGDFAAYGVDEVFSQYPHIETFIAQGNCDVNQEVLDPVSALPHVHLEEVIDWQSAGISISVSHIEDVALREAREKNKKIDVLIHGHTHRYRKEKIGNRLFLNPGALCEDGHYLILEIPELKIDRRRISAS